MKFLEFLNPISNIVDKFIPDASERLKLKSEISQLLEKNWHAISMANVKINELNAQHPSLFISGWRPYLAWICGTLILFSGLIVIASIFFQSINPQPILQFNMTVILPLLVLLIGGRSYEKSKGVQGSGLFGKLIKK